LLRNKVAYLGEVVRWRLLDPEQIKSWVAAQFCQEKEQFRCAQLLPILKTWIAHSWLMTSDRGLFLIFDDRSCPAPEIGWSLPLVVAAHSSIKEISLHSRPDELTDFLRSLRGIGAIRLDEQNAWLYSTKLFKGRVVADAIKEFILEAYIRDREAGDMFVGDEPA
jgi:hypothetical protein